MAVGQIPVHRELMKVHDYDIYSREHCYIPQRQPSILPVTSWRHI